MKQWITILRTILYSLRDIEGKTILSIDLTGKVVSENFETITINLPSGLTTLKKKDYLNRLKVYEDGKCFFILCTKKISNESAFNVLMKFAIRKLETRIDYLFSLKDFYRKQLTAA